MFKKRGIILLIFSLLLVILSNFVFSFDFKLCDYKYNDEEFVEKLYLRILNRQPETITGLDHHLYLLNTQQSRLDIAIGISLSPESKNKNINIHPDDNNKFIEHLYTQFLNRDPTSSEIYYWIYYLNQRKSREFVVTEFVKLLEFKELVDIVDYENCNSSDYVFNKDYFYLVNNYINDNSFYKYKLIYENEDCYNSTDYVFNSFNSLNKIKIDGLADYCRNYNNCQNGNWKIEIYKKYNSDYSNIKNFNFSINNHDYTNNQETNGDLPGASSNINIIFHAITCLNEEDLPNWAYLNQDYHNPSKPYKINSTTASNFINQKSDCFYDNFKLKYSFDNDYWDDLGYSNFQNGLNYSFNYNSIYNNNEIEIFFKIFENNSYIDFSNSNKISAEFYCHDDILEFDNLELVTNPVIGNTYYCIAFNSPKKYDSNWQKFNDHYSGTWTCQKGTSSSYCMQKFNFFWVDVDSHSLTCESNGKCVIHKGSGFGKEFEIFPQYNFEKYYLSLDLGLNELGEEKFQVGVGTPKENGINVHYFSNDVKCVFSEPFNIEENKAKIWLSSYSDSKSVHAKNFRLTSFKPDLVYCNSDCGECNPGEFNCHSNLYCSDNCDWKEIDPFSSGFFCELCSDNQKWFSNLDNDFCCGVNPNEHVVSRICYGGCTSEVDDLSCCNSPNSCVYDENCYDNNYYLKKKILFCNNGVWYDPNTNEEACNSFIDNCQQNSQCELQLPDDPMWVTSKGKCCGNDGPEDPDCDLDNIENLFERIQLEIPPYSLSEVIYNDEYTNSELNIIITNSSIINIYRSDIDNSIIRIDVYANNLKNSIIYFEEGTINISKNDYAEIYYVNDLWFVMGNNTYLNLDDFNVQLQDGNTLEIIENLFLNNSGSAIIDSLGSVCMILEEGSRYEFKSQENKFAFFVPIGNHNFEICFKKTGSEIFNLNFNNCFYCGKIDYTIQTKNLNSEIEYETNHLSLPIYADIINSRDINNQINIILSSNFSLINILEIKNQDNLGVTKIYDGFFEILQQNNTRFVKISNNQKKIYIDQYKTDNSPLTKVFFKNNNLNQISYDEISNNKKNLVILYGLNTNNLNKFKQESISFYDEIKIQ
jgi:hypothetical protein